MRRILQLWIPVALLFAALIGAPAARSAHVDGQAEILEALRTADLQVATSGYRLSVGAAPLCDRQEPGTGIQFHTIAQYAPETRAQVRAYFRFAGQVAVAGVVPDSPAARAGLIADDTVTSINGEALTFPLPDTATTDTLIALHRRLATLPPDQPITLGIMRGGQALQLLVRPVPACLTRYELWIADQFDASANGELVQITSKYLEAIDPALLPPVLAHELAHNILRHRDRLERAGAQFGLASGFGRNLALFRQTEMEADILAVHLLARAGYDPHLAARFWQEAGARLTQGMIRSRSHPPLAERIAIARAEAARFGGANDPLPPLPPFLDRRTEPLDGNWRQLRPRQPR